MVVYYQYINTPVAETVQKVSEIEGLIQGSNPAKSGLPTPSEPGEILILVRLRKNSVFRKLSKPWDRLL